MLVFDKSPLNIVEYVDRKGYLPSGY